MDCALILAGAVAKGAFEAGALEALAGRGVPIRRIVSSSAGSLNAAVYAAGIRTGRPSAAAASLVQLWTEHARWSEVFHASLSAMLGLRGLSKTDKVREILADELARELDAPTAPTVADRAPIELRMVVTLANGTLQPLGPGQASTFERVLAFSGPELDDQTTRHRIIDTAIASAAFPLVFLPVDLGPGLGPAFDGGAVDNAPIHHAVTGSDVERVYVVSTDPAQAPPLGNASGEALVSRLGDILIGERLFRDMADAYQTNHSLRALSDLVTDGTLTAAQLASVLAALGWQDLRPLEIIPIRPAQPLAGGAFSGFFSGDTRREYIRLGREAAEAALATS